MGSATSHITLDTLLCACKTLVNAHSCAIFFETSQVHLHAATIRGPSGRLIKQAPALVAMQCDGKLAKSQEAQWNETMRVMTNCAA